MTGKERLMAAMTGGPVDRAPIWLREGFEKLDDLPPEEDFLNGWKVDPTYQTCLRDVKAHIDVIKGWSAGDMNRFLMIPPESIVPGPVEINGMDMIRRGVIRTRRGDLPFTEQWKHHNNNRWLTNHPVNSLDDLIAVSEIPWQIDRDRIVRDAAASFAHARECVGDAGLLRFGISSPIVVISGLMSLQHFLEISHVERTLMHQLLAEITRRTVDVLDAVFESEERCHTTANLGGSEQVTPPMMAPEMFDEFVVPYDSQIIDFLKSKGILVNIHCHGKIRHALQCMKEMGIDSTDPVEPPPAGDVTFAEAQEIADGTITLFGNLEYNEFTHLDPPAIERRVREIFANGNRRVVLSASAGPTTYISPHVADNYRAFVNAGLTYGS